MRVSVTGVRIQYWVKAAVGAGLAASLLAFGAAPAPARGYVGGSVEAPSGRHFHSYASARRHHAIAYETSYAGGPPFSAIVVDVNTGRELYGVNENAPRHPASITKVMTLYLLFEQLDRGAMTLRDGNPHLRARRGAGAFQARRRRRRQHLGGRGDQSDRDAFGQ